MNTIERYQGYSTTNLIIILRFLVLNEELQALLPDLGLDVPTTAVAFPDLVIILFRTFVLGVIRLADHFRFAVLPDDRHPGFRVANMTDFVGEIRIQLTFAI
jgi:hypothetical protein